MKILFEKTAVIFSASTLLLNISLNKTGFYKRSVELV